MTQGSIKARLRHPSCCVVLLVYKPTSFDPISDWFDFSDAPRIAADVQSMDYSVNQTDATVQIDIKLRPGETASTLSIEVISQHDGKQILCLQNSESGQTLLNIPLPAHVDADGATSKFKRSKLPGSGPTLNFAAPITGPDAEEQDDVAAYASMYGPEMFDMGQLSMQEHAHGRTAASTAATQPAQGAEPAGPACAQSQTPAPSASASSAASHDNEAHMPTAQASGSNASCTAASSTPPASETATASAPAATSAPATSATQAAAATANTAPAAAAGTSAGIVREAPVLDCTNLALLLTSKHAAGKQAAGGGSTKKIAKAEKKKVRSSSLRTCHEWCAHNS